MEERLKIFTKIVRKTYDKYGLNTAFQELDFNFSLKKYGVIFRAKSGHLSNDCTYHFQIHRFDITINKNLFKVMNKCTYCKGFYPDCKLTCCNKYTHINCYLSNRSKNCCNHLVKNKVENVIKKSECVVCFESCNTKTKCNHIVCSKCMTEIKKYNSKPQCPMCRTLINPFNKLEDELFVFNFKKNKDLLIRFTYI